MKCSFQSSTVLTVFSMVICLFTPSGAPAQDSGALNVRFIDSATGFSVAPRVVARLTGEAEPREMAADDSGRLSLDLPEGDYTFEIISPEHLPFTAAVRVGADTAPLQFTLDPIHEPEELRSDSVGRLRRPDSMVFLGHVADDDTGRPLPGVVVSASTGDVSARTDDRGFFQLQAPLPADEATALASLLFHKAGYRTEAYQNVEMWPNGDWIYRVRMQRGDDSNVTNEGEGRRRAPAPARQTDDEAVMLAPRPLELLSDESVTLAGTGITTIRVPTNIRVLLTNGTIDHVSMELYVRRSLPREWIVSWNNQPGGSNSLKAGAVAIRSYAAWHVNNPRGNDHDICATTSCQVYGSTTSTATDAAVSQTAHYVVVTSSGAISRSEYSAENNSLGFSCGDGYTQPTGGCLFDPVCTGEVRFGHGRGMCQWGTIRWASGRRFRNRSMSDTVSNGHPQQNWIWIVEHYYPALMLLQGAPLVVGDDVKVIGGSNRDVRSCAGGTISSGINCPLVTTKAPGSTGVIISGPVRVTADGRGFTWWKIRWNDASSTEGWTQENWLERVIPVPAAPSLLTATAASSSQINLAWRDNSTSEIEFRIQRAPSSSGPWTLIDSVSANVTNYSDSGLSPGNTYYYRVRAWNLGGNSSFSNVSGAQTPGLAPVLAAIANRTVNEGALLMFTNTATAPDFEMLLADFEQFASGTANGSVLFRQPSFSGSTSSLLNSSPNISTVTGSLPAGNSSSRALNASWSWNSSSNPWLRLTTSGTANLPNPVIDFTRGLRFRIHTDRALNVAVGCRETTTASGTPIGADGGSTGAIEWAGVTGVTGSAPIATRAIPANTWTNLSFHFPSEPIRSFNNGNGVLSTASGLGVFEHLAFVPADGTGTYNVYLDDFIVFQPKTLAYSLDPGAPPGASVHPNTGVFTWTPAEAQGPGSYNITVRVTDNSSPPLSDAKTFAVTVNEVNTAPVLAAIADQTVHAGSTVVVTNTATDADIPANTLTYSLEAGPVGAGIDSGAGVFTWFTGNAEAGTAELVTVRVTDDGSPPLSDAKSFTVTVVARPAISSLEQSNESVTLTWSAIAGQSYRVQYKDNLSDPGWTDAGIVIATGATASITDETVSEQRFYRILVQ